MRVVLGVALTTALVGASRVASADDTQNTKKLHDGAVSGTAFWSGSPYRGSNPIHYGTAHPRDWIGPSNTEYFALEDVVIVATPLPGASPNRRHRKSEQKNEELEAETWPRQMPLECWDIDDITPCTHVVVVQGDRLLVSNHGKTALSLKVVLNGREWQSIKVEPRSEEVPIDMKRLREGVYDLLDERTRVHVGWLYRMTSETAVAGATDGNCRYSIGLEPGRYRIVARHPYLSSVEQLVDIRAGRISHTNLVFSQKNLGR